MKELELSLKTIARDLEAKKQYITSEAVTISALIDPLIKALDYDTTDPRQIHREYDADARMKKGEKVDIAILKDGKPIIFIECKKLGESLNNHVGQLNSYFVAVPELNYAILTNGSEYRFYKASKEKTNIMELNPFLVIDITKSLSTSQLQTLFTFNSTQFDPDKLNNTIDLLATETAIKKFMNSLLENSLTSDDEFTNLIIKETPFKHKRGESRNKFSVLASKYIKQWLDEIVRDRINEMAKKQIEEESKENIIQESNIVTTEEEMEAYYIIKSICTEKVVSSKINYQVYQGFFSVYYDGKKTKHICKLYLNDRKKEIEIIENKPISITSLDDLYTLKDQLFTKLESLQS